MTTTQIPHVSFAQAVMLRPGMYTLNGTLHEVIVYLEGYHSGMAKGNPYAAPVQEWEAFRRWLANQLCVQPSQAFVTFVQRHQSEQSITQTLVEQYSQFLEAQQAVAAMNLEAA